MNSLIPRLSLILFWCSLVCSTSNALEATLRGNRQLGIGGTEAPTDVANPGDPIIDGTIGDIGASDPELSILVELITLAGVGGLLSSEGPYTVFAPTNAAFEEVVADIDNLEVLDAAIILELLSYHVVFGTYMASDITDGLILPTFQGETIEFHVNENGAFVNEEVISAVDLTASNGVVHKIDGVMFPQSILGPETEAPVVVGTIGDVGASDPDLSILVELITLAGVGGLLSSEGPYTVFAPTNAAWEEVIIDPENLEILDVNVVLTILSYHVVPGIYTASDITDGLILGTLQGETIEFHVNENGAFVNEEVISTVDLTASNGVVHKIDGVMWPQEVLGPETEAPVAVGTIGDAGASDPDLSILVELITLAGVGGLLSSEGPYTVFAPTNAAWEEVIIEPDNLEILDTTVVLTILSYHVVPGITMASDITDGLILGTFQGETIEFHVNENGTFVNEEVISAVDILASNGVVHKIDGVMWPQEVLGPEE